MCISHITPTGKFIYLSSTGNIYCLGDIPSLGGTWCYIFKKNTKNYLFVT